MTIHTVKINTPFKACLLATSLMAGTSYSAIIATDQFLTGAAPGAGEYTTGNVVPQNPTVTGFSGAWTTGVNSPDVISGGLTFSNGSGTVGTAGGALQATAANSDRAGHVLSSAYTDASSGTIYLGFLLSLSSDNSGAYRAFEMHNGGYNDATQRVFQLGQSSGDFGTTEFGLRVNNNNGLRLDLGTADTSTHLFVMRIDLSTTLNSDSITVWNNPADLASEGGSTAAGTLSGFNFNFDRLSLAAFIGGDIKADEFRMGTTWQDVTTVPEPTAALLGGLGLMALLRRRR